MSVKPVSQITSAATCITSSNDDLSDIVRKKIENMRTKLLDLSRVNPLISTKLSPRSNSHIRVIDEVPEVLFSQLCGDTHNGSSGSNEYEHPKFMRFVPLPELDEDPRDEDTAQFKHALASARQTDEIYLAAAQSLDTSNDEVAEENRKLERQLKDRVRVSLGMPPRTTSRDTSLQQHAKNNGISPSYDLPTIDNRHEDGRHMDDCIQTLLLPDELERKMNALLSKHRTWEQETGINILYAAFGFLEWIETQSSETCLSPLILFPVQIEKVKTRGGTEFRVTANTDEVASNAVLAEKFKRDFGIDLPKFETDCSIEQYFLDVVAQLPRGLNCKVRRQVAFGVFPSTRLAMFHDLDTSTGYFENNLVVKEMIAGSENVGATPFGDEYDVDNPEIEKKVPYLVREADSSQFSTLVDIADGKNLAVEGPPGTGKSQTIVNAIAIALAERKKVLFVAEKKAALDVVKSRLEAIGLGEYILPLQAEHSAREQVISSVSDRINMECEKPPSDYASKIERYKEIRSELASYIEIISAPYGTKGLSSHDIIWRNIKLHEVLRGLPPAFQKPKIDNAVEYDSLRVESIKQLGDATANSWVAAMEAAPYWQGIKLLHMDKFLVDEICILARDASESCRLSAKARKNLEAFGIDAKTDQNSLNALSDVLKTLESMQGMFDVILLPNFCVADDCELILQFLRDCERVKKIGDELSEVFENIELDWADKLHMIYNLCREYNITTLDIQQLRSERNAKAGRIAALHTLHQELTQFIKMLPESSRWTVAILRKAANLIAKTTRNILAIRNEVTASPASAVIIEQAANIGRRLKKDRDWLQGIFSTIGEISIAELTSSLNQISESGPLSIISSNYRAARKFYLRLTRRREFSKQNAINDLESFIEWKNAEQKFLSDPQVAAVFGLYFNGLDTNFELFEQLVNYYRSVEQEFQGIINTGVRRFLKLGDLEIFPALPENTADIEHRTLEEITGEINSLERELEGFDAGLTRLISMITGLKAPASIVIDSLPVFAECLQEHCKLKYALDNNYDLRKILAHKFEGAITANDGITDTINAAQTIVQLGQNASIALNICLGNQLIQAISAIAEVLDRDRTAIELVKNIERRTGIEIDRLMIDRLPSDGTAEYLEAASKDSEGLRTHSIYETYCSELAEKGFGWVVPALLTNNCDLTNLDVILEASIARAQAMNIYNKHGQHLTKYSGRTLDELRNQFAKLDRSIIKLSQKHLRAKLFQLAKPPAGIRQGRKSDLTEMGLVNNEINKTKRFISVRELTHRAGNALLELKPCWMMSPLAVAQYVPKDLLKFDLVIIDEASQMPPEDAIGALARGQQAMVVGDKNQLPPTSFWKKILDDEQEDEDEVVSNQSILELANAAFRPPRRLRWHYRSRHSALIKFSNHIIYDDDLIIFPSAEELDGNKIVLLEQVPGIYKSGVNEEEARVMIDAIFQFMRDNPNLSLGVVTLNKKQCDLINEQWDYAVARNPIALKYIEKWTSERDGLEEFFIKNLENVQGDERDVIFIGTVYGPEKLDGPVHNRFGPINGVAGRRRLNVLFSRAKHRIVTFTSMTSADIKAEDENDNAGSYMLKRWLEYSATGVLHTGQRTNRSPDSDFEDFVMDQIKSMGCEPIPQVGVAGYFIDIGVKHPNWPHGYVMAVECDGASYHSTKSARDRDRLREEQLKDRGWFFHRIWSTDWFNDPHKEAERLRTAIKTRMEQLKNLQTTSIVPLIKRAYNTVNSSTDQTPNSVTPANEKSELVDHKTVETKPHASTNTSVKQSVTNRVGKEVTSSSVLDKHPQTNHNLATPSVDKSETMTVYEKPWGNKINIYLQGYKGNQYLHIREWYLDGSENEEKPTKKGVAIPQEKIRDLVSALAIENSDMRTIHEKFGNKINVYVQEYKGNKYLHIREWYLDLKDNQDKPTNRGVAIPLEKIDKLRRAIELISTRVENEVHAPSHLT